MEDRGVRVRVSEGEKGIRACMGGGDMVGQRGSRVECRGVSWWDGMGWDRAFSTHECSDDPRFVDGQVRREDGIPGHGWTSGSQKSEPL